MNNAFTTNINDVEGRCAAGYYDYIIIGSGMGGGTLARCLIGGDSGKEHTGSPRVLVIERGSLQFSTHCMNTPTPGWYRKEGPSMSTDVVFQSIKSPIKTVTSNSVPYVGGPVHCLGGRSNVWGMYAPPLDAISIQRYLGDDIKRYLFDADGYKRAYKLLSNGGSLEAPYPISPGLVHIMVERVDRILQAFNNIYQWPQITGDPYRLGRFTLCPMGTEFFQSTRRKVTTVNYEGEQIISFTVLDPERKYDQLRTIPTGGATVVLSCGTIDTAALALRSRLSKIPDGLSELSPKLGWSPNEIGVGLTDHDIWGVRFDLGRRADAVTNALHGQALRIQAWATLFPDDERRDIPYLIDPQPLSESGHRDREPLRLELPQASANPSDRAAQCLINITINATSFLGSSLYHESSKVYLDENQNIISEKAFNQNYEEGRKSSLQVVFEFDSQLQDDNKVLNLPRSAPTIEIPSREDKRPYLASMRRFAFKAALLCGQPTLLTHTSECLCEHCCGSSPELKTLGDELRKHDILTAATKGAPLVPGTLDPQREVEQNSSVNYRKPDLETATPYRPEFEDLKAHTHNKRYESDFSSGPEECYLCKNDSKCVSHFIDGFNSPNSEPMLAWARLDTEIKSRGINVERAPFGVVANEVGTMRMEAPIHTRVELGAAKIIGEDLLGSRKAATEAVETTTAAPEEAASNLRAEEENSFHPTPCNCAATESGGSRGLYGVVNDNLRFKGLNNLYVCDLSVFPWSPAANPSLTLVALAQRLADRLECLRKDKNKAREEEQRRVQHIQEQIRGINISKDWLVV
ncbi:hypothetical protein TWF225_011726 [Orbilia oligospora]|uniref:Glucose-methanol-choline oxidoreductase C-terminal domain-containing protein n=1 Tax=Orbilia oligospora TaxID=2813651 RepID=A0A7C8KKE4_ORBOL|nr:hypothetical protein TWF751_006921 [Orbilia oligospora]KAF3192944.1 hypothetical protein TWF225_011726 [Orbilia oligospora]KAF3259382.1 hypothetical protein TWF128_004445 [Orbilia oligospora]TGJ74911.1 hypothetical protein EYR41_001868 [Orbilia oligospora]